MGSIIPSGLLVNQSLTAVALGVSRYFTPMYAVQQSYIKLNNDAILDGDFTLFTRSALPPSRGNLFGADTEDRFELLVNDTQSLIAFDNVNKSFYSVNVSTYIDNRLHEIQCKYKSGVFEILIDGNSLGAKPVSIPPTRISYVGRTQSFQPYYNEIIADASALTTVGAFSYSIDQDYTETDNIIVDKSGNGNHATFVNVVSGDSVLHRKQINGNFISENLLGNNSFLENDGWIDSSAGTGEVIISNGVAIVSGDSFANRGDLKKIISTRKNASYTATLEIIEGNSAFLVVRSTSEGLIEAYSIPEGVSRVTLTFVATSSLTEISVRSQGGVSKFSKITLTNTLEVAY